MPKPIAGTYPPYFENYISLVKEDNLFEAFKNQHPVINSFFDAIPEEKSGYAYAPGKWTIRELMQHIIDTERIFNYRALCIARKETVSLPGFDENTYAANSNANARTWKSLCDELKAVRISSELLFESFTPEMLDATGIANEKPCNVMALGFILVGHINHHIRILQERYL